MVRRQARRLRRSAFGLALKLRDLVLRRTARARELLGPVLGTVSGPAWWGLVLAVAGLVLSYTVLHWIELQVAGTMILLLLACCTVFVIGRQVHAARIDLGRDRIVVGESASGALVVTNESEHRALTVFVELPVGAALASFVVPPLASGASHEELFTIPTERRAVLDVGPVRAIRADPLRLLNRARVIHESTLLYVHPRTVAVEGVAAGLMRDLEGAIIRKNADNDVAFHTLREYVPGDDRRNIHWKSTARTGTLMVRQFDETRRAHMLVVLGTRPSEYGDADEFELAVSIAGSLGKQVLADEQTVTLRTSMETLRSASARALLDQLAGVDYEPAAPRIALAVRNAERAAAGASVAVILCGSTVSAGMLRRARSFLPLDVRTVAIRAQLDAETTVRSVGDIDLVTLGDLAELPGVVRSLIT